MRQGGPDIHVVGLGMRAPDHVTPEAEAALRASREVLFVDTGIATRAFLEARCPRVTSLFEESYVPGRNRLEAYHHMAARVLDAALDHAPVALALHGHPAVFSLTPFLVAAAARLLDLRVEILPGISSLDCLFAEIGLDPGTSGLLSYEATDLLLRRRPLLPDVPTLLWQVGNLETRLHADRPSRPERLARLQAYLLEAYPPGHPVTVFYATPHPLLPSTAFAFPLGELAAWAPALHAGVTIFLPPAARRPIADPDLLLDIDDPAHLGKITR